MTRISTGSETVPKALRLLDVVHEAVQEIERSVRRLDPRLVGSLPDATGGRLRVEGAQLWALIGTLAQTHAHILQAAGELTDADILLLAPYASPETYDDGRYTFGDGIKDAAGGIVDFSYRYSAFFATLGTMAGKGGSFSSTFASEYASIKKSNKTIEPALTWGTEFALLWITKPAAKFVALAELPFDVRQRYEAAGARLVSEEAKRTSAAVATSIRGGSGALVGKVLPSNAAGDAVSKLLASTDAEQEAFARGIGDLHGAVVDGVAGHPESLDKVVEGIAQGQYGSVLRNAYANEPASLEELIGLTSGTEVVVVPGAPKDRDAPAYAPHGSTA